MEQSAIDWAEAKAKSLAVAEYTVVEHHLDEMQARFSDNSLSVVNRLLTTELGVYLAKGRKRVLGSLSSTGRRSVEEFVEKLFASMNSTSAESDFAPLPAGGAGYSHNGDADASLDPFDQAACAKSAIQAALSAGASRVAGSLTARRTLVVQRTSAGLQGSDERTSYLLNVRAFADKDASGHGVSVATRLRDLETEQAGRRAGEWAKKSRNPRQPEEGVYSVIFGRTVAADLFQHVGRSASAFAMETGLSFLPEKSGERAGSDRLTVKDHGQIEGGPDSRSFDDEGRATSTTVILDGGQMARHLHNSTTAAKHGAEPTGNAGIISPRPWNIEVVPGSSDIEEMVRETKRGIFVTNNWYTRFQSYKTGEYSTLPRDAAFYIEGGRIGHPVAGFRISDSIPRQLGAVTLLGRERSWIEWWEVSTPVLQPDMLVDGVRITRAAT
ncbi:MAG: TldD/PmbA family protein [Nitrososphaerota archaeon]|nr:TldD/PmbA family protein [Nitrososphaerota archaeon]MDG6939411.1 TldD/PmbA family protein [Nitrososphaerota archaeon]